MGSSITGPGLSMSAGGSSEIAAVSVGVYVVDNTGVGFAKVEAAAAVQGAKIGAAEGAAAGVAFTDAHQTGILGGLQSVGKLKRAFHHIIAGLLFGPLVVYEAFEFGKKIGNFIIEGMGRAGKTGVKAFEDDLKAGASKMVEVATELGGKIAGAQQKELDEVRDRISKFERPLFGTQQYADALLQLRADQGREKQLSAIIAREIAEQKEQQKQQREIEATAEAYRRGYAMMEDAAKQFRAQEAVDHAAELKEQKDLADGFRMMDEAADEFHTQQRELNEEGAQMGDEMLSRFKEYVALVHTMDSRRRAAESHSLDNLGADASQIRNLIRIGMRQRFPDPGSGEY